MCQKPDVGSDFIQDIFYQVKGKPIMENILKHYEKDTLVTEFIKDFDPKRKKENKILKLTSEEYLLDELKQYILDHKDMFLDTEESRGTRTRSESSFEKDTLLSIVANYIDDLWEGIEERLQYFDSDGTTSWSEAPAEEVFSILDYL